MSILRKLGLGAAGAALLAALAWGLWPQPMPVDLAPVTRGPMQGTITAQGVTRVRNPYAITAPITGAATRSPVEVGDQVIASYWREGAGFHNNLAQGGRVRTDLAVPEAAINLVQGLARYLDINHAGFDVAWVDEHPYILEFNRLFGNRGMPELNKRVQQAMSDYLLSSPCAPPPSSDISVSA